VTRFEYHRHPRVEARKAAGPVKVADQHASGSAVQRFNTRVALVTTRAVGSMWCAYAFALFDCLALPQAIQGGLFGIVQWVASFFLQLVLLSIIMVGQTVQADAADKRAEATYLDAEAVLHDLEQAQLHLEAQDAHLLAQDDKLGSLITRVDMIVAHLTSPGTQPRGRSSDLGEN
jgi:hypothetical protein